MELTLTGASLNTEGPSGRGGPVSGGTGNTNMMNSTRSSHFHSHEHSEHAKGGAEYKESDTMTHTKTVSAGVAMSHSHSHSHGNKPCCNDHHINPSTINTSYIDVTNVPKDKLTANPTLLMDALLKSIRGKGTFDTFTYLVQIVLEFENQTQNAMKWGRRPPVPPQSHLQQQPLNQCQSCLNNYTNDGHTIAHWCAKREDDIRFLKYIVQHVPNINLNLPSLDEVGMRPIHWACTEGSIPNVAFFLAHYNHHNYENNDDGQKEEIIDAVDSSSCTPLLVASQYGHADLVAFLIKRGANPYAVDSSGDTAFHWAAYKGSVPVCSLLLHLHTVHSNSHRRIGDLYGYLDLQDSFGQTPLHLASLRGNIDVVTYIMEEAEQFVDRNLTIVSAMRHVNNNNNNNIHDVESLTTPATATTSNGADKENSNTNNNENSLDMNIPIEQYPNMLLHIHDRNSKTPLNLAQKKNQTSTILLLQTYMDKHSFENHSFIRKTKTTVSQLFSIKNWLLWMGLVSEGGGRPPKFIFWFVVLNLFIASMLEVGVYGKFGWMNIKYQLLGSGGGDVSSVDSSAAEVRFGDIRLAKEYLVLHYMTYFGFIMTWLFLYFVNQTDPGILTVTTSFLDMEDGMTARGIKKKILNMIYLFVRRLFVCIPTTAWRGSSSWRSYSSCANNENKRIKKEVHRLSLDLRRQYDETLESFALSTDNHDNEKLSTNHNKDQPQLCHSCHIVRPTRSKHCRVLNRCILLFDHHCPFVGTTIGLYNYKYFYAFVFFFTLADILFTLTGFLYWKNGEKVVITGDSTGAGSSGGKPSMELWMLLSVFYFSLYTIMTGGLFIYHTQLIKSNLTTNEHQNMYRYDYLKSISKDGSIMFKNPFDKGFVHNLLSRLVPSKDTYVCDSVRKDSAYSAANNDDYCDKNGLDNVVSSSFDRKIEDDYVEKMRLVPNMV